MLDPERRRQSILTDAKNLAFAQGFELVEDEGLLTEVAGLVEWPVVLMGAFERSLPRDPGRGDPRHHPQQPEMLRAARPARPRKLVNRFILVSNTEAKDGGKAIVAGNERVIRARLSDAKFFYETDLKVKLEDRLPKFENIIFHEKFGSQAERIERIERLAAKLAPLVGADVAKAEARCAARQGRSPDRGGRRIPRGAGPDGPILRGSAGRGRSGRSRHRRSLQAARAGRSACPADPVSIAVALADKFDMLVSFWAIDEKPTGTKDPYALRRAALGVIRLVLETSCSTLRFRIES